MKAVFWTKTEVFIYAFAPRMSENEEEEEKQITSNRRKALFRGMEDFEIENIFDFGVS
jgi:hypothetical protein